MRALPLLQADTPLPRHANVPAAAPAERTPITEALILAKANIFSRGLFVPDDLWAELTDENHYRHKRAGLSQGRFFRLHDGAASTAVNAPVLEPFARKSPLHLRREGAGYAIFESDTRLCAATPFAWPRWYGRTTSDGTPMSMVVSAHCDTSLYTAIYQGGCDYWQGDQMCKFCAMKIDQKARWRSVDSIIEVVKVALEENPAAEISFGGGTRLTPDKSARHKADAIAELKKRAPLPVCVEMAPPDTDDWLDRLRDAGLDSILLNIELWDEDVRRHMMPGKADISRDRYLSALRHSVKIFGSNQVSSQIIIGLEPLKDTLAAVRAVIDEGAIPLPVVFRPLPGTPLENSPPPPVDDVMTVFSETYRWMGEASLAGQESRSGCALCGACSAHR
ncbi:MAG: radical SAM protein [Polyangiaceae bacterium]